MVPALVSSPSPSPATTWRALLYALLLFVLGDVVVFRSGLYAWLAKPESSGGWVTKRTLLAPPPIAAGDVASVLLLGDSRIGEAIDEHALREQLGAPPVAVAQASLPGSSPRVWAQLFEHLPQPPGGFSLVVLGLPDYDDDAGQEDQQHRLRDLAFLGPSLGPTGAFEMAAELRGEANPHATRDVWLATLLKSFAWRRDVQDLAADPYTRYREVRRQFGRARWAGPYAGNPGSLAGVHAEGDTVRGLPNANQQDQVLLEHLVFHRDDVDNTAYRRRWLGELADRVRASGAELVIVRLPLQVLPRSKPRVPATAVVDELAQRAGVHVLPYELLAGAEAPEFFFDALHVNRDGRQLCTRLLGEQLLARFAGRLGRPR